MGRAVPEDCHSASAMGFAHYSTAGKSGRQSSACGQFANRSLADRSFAVIVLLIVLVLYPLGILLCDITLHSFPTLVLYALKKNKKSATDSPSYGVSKGQAAYAVRFAEP